MRVTGGMYTGKMVLAFALAIVGFLYGSGADAQTPADDQYGSPTEIGVPAAMTGQDTNVLSAAGSSEGSGYSSAGADGTPSFAASSAGASGGSAADDPSSSTGSSEATASGNGSRGVLATALPATGGSLLSLTGLVALALAGTGVLLFWRKPARD